jgi:hypothetical protein
MKIHNIKLEETKDDHNQTKANLPSQWAELQDKNSSN